MTKPDNISEGMRGASKALCVLLITAATAMLTRHVGFNFEQIISTTVFALIISAALFFWDYHLPIAFVGIAVLMVLKVMDLPNLVASSKLDIVLFLVGMMIIVGVLKELGLFSWIIITIITIPGISARMFVILSCIIGAIMSCMVDEITSMVFIAALIFQVCDTLNLKPTPFIIMAVMTINIGSAGTMLGNPVGILIGQNASPPLSFNDFMIWSFPLMLAELAVVMGYLLWSFRKEIREMDASLAERRKMGLPLGPLVKVPFAQGLFILISLMVLLSLHTAIEDWLGLSRNTMLLMTPLLASGLLMLWRREHIRHYVENDVEWLTLIFFMMLFVVAGTLEHTRVTAAIADGLASALDDRTDLLLPVILGISAIGSAFIENVIFVAAFLPVVTKLEYPVLLWALLHGACLGGNITMIGSTANIAAIGLLEKRYWTRMAFFTWAKTGVMTGILSCLVAWGGLTLLSPYMPTRLERLRQAGLAVPETPPPAPTPAQRTQQ